MESIIGDLRELAKSYSLKFGSISDADFSAKPHPSRWSKKEVLGHLIDSAHNNLRRFIAGQAESAPPKIVYDQDFWVQANDYVNVSKENMITLWTLLNEQIATVLAKMPRENYSLKVNTGKKIVELHSLQWLAEDYVKHLKHHLNQIILGSFEVVYR